MPSIFTHYMGPTNHRAGRVKAATATKKHSVTLEWDHGLTVPQNHQAAAMELITRMEALAQGGWAGEWLQADAGLDGGYVFVRLNSGDPTISIPHAHGFKVGDKVHSIKAPGFTYEVVKVDPHGYRLDVRCVGAPDDMMTDFVYEGTDAALYIGA